MFQGQIKNKMATQEKTKNYAETTRVKASDTKEYTILKDFKNHFKEGQKVKLTVLKAEILRDKGLIK